MSLKCIQNIVRKNIVREAEQSAKRMKVTTYTHQDFTNADFTSSMIQDDFKADGLGLRGIPRQQFKRK